MVDSMHLRIHTSTRVAHFKWKDGLPESTYVVHEKGRKRNVIYEYDENRRMIGMSDANSDKSYSMNYDEQGRMHLLESRETGGKIGFVFNNTNQIVSQHYVEKGDTIRILEFEYNEQGLPIHSYNIDPKANEKVSRIDFSYSDAPNPLTPFGMMVNVFEANYGRPIGICGKQINGVTINFLRDVQTRMNGGQPQAGDSETIDWKLEEDERGNTTFWHMTRGKLDNEARFWYSCPN